jgi:hypothetical protein
MAMLLGVVVLAACALVEPQWSPHAGEPPHQLVEMDEWEILSFQRGEIAGRAQYRLSAKSIEIDWTHQPSGARASQTVTLSYWPTSLCSLHDKNTLVVGGKRPITHTTTIETMKINQPIVLESFPEGTSKVLLQPVPVGEIDVVYDSAVQGRDMTVSILRNLGRTGHVFVQFEDSKDVYDLDVSSGPAVLQLVASPTSQDAPVYQPALSKLSDVVWEADHIPTGYVYFYDPRGNSPGFATYLVDRDRDGDLDDSGVIDDDSWAGSPWSDSKSYIFDY